MSHEEYCATNFVCNTALKLKLQPERQERGPEALLVLDPTCPAAIINDTRGTGRAANCKCYPIADSDSSSVVREVCVEAIRPIKRGERLLMQYGAEFGKRSRRAATPASRNSPQATSG